MTSAPRELAEAAVCAWIERDYEPDEIDPRWLSAAALERLVVRVADLLACREAELPKKSSAAMPRDPLALGAPHQVAEGAEPERVWTCTAYETCLAHAARERWPSWTCAGCEGPGHSYGNKPGSSPQLSPDGTSVA